MACQVFADGFCAGVLGLTQKQWDKRKKNRAYWSANRERLREHYARKREEARAARPPRVKKGRDADKRRASQRRHYQRHREKVLARAAKYRSENPYATWSEAQKARHHQKKRIARRKRGLKRLPDCFTAHVKAWQLHLRARPTLHDAHVKLFYSDKARVWRWRYAHDIQFNLQQRLRNQLKKKRAPYNALVNSIIGDALRGAQKAKRLERLVGYTMEELRKHLERQFLPGMTWQSRGKDGWHIDHILPKRCFDLSDEQGVRAYWSLSNLRPLWAKDNLAKGAKIDIWG